MVRIVVVALGIVFIALGMPSVAAANSTTALEQRSLAALADTETALAQLWAERAAPLRAALAARTTQIDEDQKALWNVESELLRARASVAAIEGRLSPIDLERRDRVAATSSYDTTTLTLATGRAIVATLEASVTPRREILRAHRAEVDALTAALDSATAQRVHARELALAGDRRAAAKAAEADAAARAVGPLAAAMGIAPTTAFTFAAPVTGHVTSPFGARGTEFHDGIDIGTPLGAPVVASAAGTVVAAGQPYLASGDTAFGVIIDHGNGFSTLYWHLAPVLAVKVGQKVEAGAALGRIGLTGRVTGPHLHYSVLFNGRPVDPARVQDQTAP